MKHDTERVSARYDVCRVAVAVCVGFLSAALSVAGQGDAHGLELANNQVAVRFSPDSGAVVSISNRLLGVAYTAGAPAPGLFGLHYLSGTMKNPKALEQSPGAVISHSLSRQKDVQTLQMDYRLAGPRGGHVRVTCRASLTDGASDVRWRITVDNQAEGTEVVEVVYPVLGGLRIGRKTEDNVLAWPKWGAGRLIEEPQKQGRLNGTYVGGGATMAWMDLFSRPAAAGTTACGLYFASHDPSLLMTGLYSHPADDKGSLTFQMKKYARVRAGQTWPSAEFVTQVHAGDWHAGADTYRTWFCSWAPPSDPPAWLKRCDGRVEWTLPLDGSGRFDQDIPKMAGLSKRLGLDFVRLGGQMIPSLAAGKHRCNRFPFPDPLMGSESEFTEVLDQVRRQGCRVAFYINGQAWDPRWPACPTSCAGMIPASVKIPDWEAGFKRNALHRYDGTLYSQYRKAAGHWPAPEPDSPYGCLFYFMCMASQGWQDHLYDWTVEKYVKQYHAGAMFLDQLGAESAKYCYNPAHGHTHHGAWSQGVVALAKRIKEEARRIDPDFALETEGYGDAYASYFDSFFIAPSSTGVWSDSFPELARYTFPEHIFFDGYWSIQNPAYKRTPEEMFNEVFLIGNRFLVYAQPNVLTKHLSDVINLRKRIKHVQYSARFMDDVGVTVSDANVRVKRFVLDEPERKVTLLTIYNRESVAGANVEVALDALGPVREAAVAVIAEHVNGLDVNESATHASFAAPKGKLSAVLLVHRGTDVIRLAREATQIPPLNEKDTFQ